LKKETEKETEKEMEKRAHHEGHQAAAEAGPCTPTHQHPHIEPLFSPFVMARQAECSLNFPASTLNVP
jgi:hypothetical protein